MAMTYHFSKLLVVMSSRAGLDVALCVLDFDVGTISRGAGMTSVFSWPIPAVKKYVAHLCHRIGVAVLPVVVVGVQVVVVMVQLSS